MCIFLSNNMFPHDRAADDTPLFHHAAIEAFVHARRPGAFLYNLYDSIHHLAASGIHRGFPVFPWRRRPLMDGCNQLTAFFHVFLRL